MSLQTPTVIRTLQRKLYRKAKERKLLHRRRLRPKLFSVCLTMKPVGEPDAGDRHVRFDERGWETERCRMAQVTVPILDSAECDIARSRMDFRFRGKNGHAADITGMTESVKVFGCRPLREGWRAHGRPASENLQGRKPREG